jgi:putative transposase
MGRAPQEIRTFFVTAVTWQRRSLFRAEPMARLFLDTLARYRKQGQFPIHEFVLMPDHFHVLLTPAPEISLEKALQLLKGGFSFRVKRELGSNAEVWQEGFTEHRVKNAEDFERHAVYVRDNPLRARLAENAAAYPYGSAAGGIEVDSVPPGLKPRISKDAVFAGLKSGASTDER